jgi:uridine phosphorylase
MRRPPNLQTLTRGWSRLHQKQCFGISHGALWDQLTTDAPFRETAEAIEVARAKGILAVEMEAAALYTFANTAGVQLLCLAHVTNTMGRSGDDFEKGEADGTRDALSVLEKIIKAVYVETSDRAAESRCSGLF